MKLIAALLGLLVVSFAAVVAFSAYRWRTDTDAAVARLLRGSIDEPQMRFSAADLEGLPAPVARYFRAVLQDGQLLVRQCRIRQAGHFLVRPEKNAWGPFTAVQYLTSRPAGFVWDARIRMAPGVDVYVRDALIGESGSMLGKALGLFTVVRLEHTAGITAGALHRYLAEAVWCPTALLPAAGVIWTAVDDSTARASLSAGTVTVTLDFHFGADSLVRSVFTAERQYAKDGRTMPMPWQGRWTEYGERNGVRVPLAGEVEWLLPEGPQPYWRGRAVEIVHDDQVVR